MDKNQPLLRYHMRIFYEFSMKNDAILDCFERMYTMLTGDSESAARRMAESLGLDEFVGDVLPENKAGIVRKLRAARRQVIMVGDGINDSPALAEADVSVAMKDASYWRHCCSDSQSIHRRLQRRQYEAIDLRTPFSLTFVRAGHFCIVIVRRVDIFEVGLPPFVKDATHFNGIFRDCIKQFVVLYHNPAYVVIKFV
jgi:hypothetical protein